MNHAKSIQLSVCKPILAIAALFFVLGGVDAQAGQRMEMESSCTLFIDGIGYDGVRACARDNAHAELSNQCGALGGIITNVSTRAKSCKVVLDMTVECFAKASGTCQTAARAGSQPQVTQPSQGYSYSPSAYVAIDLDAIASIANQQAAAKQAEENHHSAWKQVAKNANKVCEFVSSKNYHMGESCFEIAKNSNVSREGAQIAMSVAFQNYAMANSAIEAASGNRYTAGIVKLCSAIAEKSGPAGIECLINTANKQYSANELAICERQIDRSYVTAVECLTARGH